MSPQMKNAAISSNTGQNERAVRLNSFDSLKEYLSSQSAQTQAAAKKVYSNYHNESHTVISLVAYLIGVEKKHFENDYEPPKLETFEQLEKKRDPRIVRNLCRIRTALEKNYKRIRTAFYYDLKNLGTLPQLIPTDAVRQLSEDGIQLQKSTPNIDQYLITINKELSNRVGAVKGEFPDWINWDYIRPIFIMPNGFKPEGLKAAWTEYNNNRNRYPYQCYINWSGGERGNILYNDEKFVTLLYELNEDRFENLSLVKDAGNITLNNIYNFLERSEKTVVAVDCENSDPVKLAATLSSLSAAQSDKISKIMLFDSEYTTSSWKVLSRLETLTMEHILIKRLNQHKSQVDMSLATRICQEVYTNAVDSVILVSSDSDYWALIQTLADINFLVMIERGKCSGEMKGALESRNIHYCYIDDFCTGASYTIKTSALIEELQGQLDERISFNVQQLLDEALRNTWIQMSPRERNSFYERYLKKLSLTIDGEGNARAVINRSV